MTSPLLAYAPLVISIVVGLNMLWTEIMRGRNLRRQAGVIDQTTLEGKHIDDSIAWRKDILDENKTLRTDLSGANRLIAELSITHAASIRIVSERVESAISAISAASTTANRNNEILEKWMATSQQKNI